MESEPRFDLDAMHAAVIAEQSRDLASLAAHTLAPSAPFRFVPWESRAEAFGASELGALLDVSPYESRADLIYRKAHAIDVHRKPAMLLGQCLEAGILAFYVALTHREAHPWGERKTIASDAFPRLVVTPDASEPDAGTGPCLLEIKHSAGGKGWGTGRVIEEHEGFTVHEGAAAPLAIQVQTVAQLAVTGYPRARVVGLIRGKLRIYEIARHEGVISRIREECVSGWAEVAALRAASARHPY